MKPAPRIRLLALLALASSPAFALPETRLELGNGVRVKLEGAAYDLSTFVVADDGAGDPQLLIGRPHGAVSLSSRAVAAEKNGARRRESQARARGNMIAILWSGALRRIKSDGAFLDSLCLELQRDGDARPVTVRGPALHRAESLWELETESCPLD